MLLDNEIQSEALLKNFFVGKRYKNRLDMAMRTSVAIYLTSRSNPMQGMGEKTSTT